MAAMLDGRNNTISPLWEMKSIFMQKSFIVPAMQHGCHPTWLPSNVAAMQTLYSKTANFKQDLVDRHTFPRHQGQ